MNVCYLMLVQREYEGVLSSNFGNGFKYVQAPQLVTGTKYGKKFHGTAGG